MKVVKTIEEVRKTVAEWRKEGDTIGLVPTMGYLHEGHQSLIKRSVEENSRTVVSVFVNPIQFAPNEDLASYPRDLEKDSNLCNETGADLIFAPSDDEMYDKSFCTYVDMNGLTNELCGITRPTHFRGVMTVVTKLFNIVRPDRAYFGQKDAQQLAVIRQMVNDLSMGIEIVGCPIVREGDGLARSSRNTYLSPEERKSALVLSRAVRTGESMVERGEKDTAAIIKAMKTEIEKESLARIDYVKAVDARTIEQVERIDGPTLFAMAVYIGRTRLIDNFITR